MDELNKETMSDLGHTSSNKLNSLSEALSHLESPRVRDLAWVIGSSDLVSLIKTQTLDLNWLSSYQRDLKLLPFDSWRALQHALPYLSQLNHDPGPLDSALQDYAQNHKRVRLGVYYEHLTYYWLEHILKASALRREIQLYSYAEGVKQTLGALDIVATLSADVLEILTRSKQTESLTIHFELASKFYLKVPQALAHQTPDQSIPSHYYKYVGPNERDCFGGKLHRLYNHQLPLSQGVEALAHFSTNDMVIDARCLWLKGRVFEHGSDWTAKTGVKALWLRQNEIPILYSDFNQDRPLLYAFLCTKPAWLAPPCSETMLHTEQIKSCDLLERAQHARGERGSTLWFLHSFNQQNSAWLMIVPDDWGTRT